MSIVSRTLFVAGHPARPLLVAFALVASVVAGTRVEAAIETAYSNFGPGNTYGNFGQTIGGQFVNGYQFTSAAAGPVVGIDVGMGSSGTFNLALYSDSSNVLGTSLWNVSNIPVGSGSPNPAQIEVVGGPTLELGQKYWLVASGPAPSAFWSPNTTSATGRWYHQDSGGTSYLNNATPGAFAVRVAAVPEPGVICLAVGGLFLVNGFFARQARGQRG